MDETKKTINLKFNKVKKIALKKMKIKSNRKKTKRGWNHKINPILKVCGLNIWIASEISTLSPPMNVPTNAFWVQP